jgi:hypothetical protein
MGIEEEAVRSPRIWLDTLVEVIVPRYLRQMATVLLLDVFLMFSMFSLNVSHPDSDGDS